MGRAEAYLDPERGPVQRFASELRRVRREAGSPSYRTLAQRSHYSAAALSQAAAGKSLPTLAVTLAYVKACGAEVGEWEGRWREVACQVREAEAGTVDAGRSPDPTGAAGSSPGARWSARRRLALLGAGVVAAMLAATAVIVGQIDLAGGDDQAQRSGNLAVPTSSATPSALLPSVPTWPDGPAELVADGSDPKRSHCDAEVVTLASTEVKLSSGQLAGILELRYSQSCRTGWARFSPAVALPKRPTVLVTVFTNRPADGRRRPFTVSYAGWAIIGDMLFATQSCVLAEIAITEDGKTMAKAATACKKAPSI